MNQDKIAQRRAEILAASLDVFAQKGYHAAKIADIAERLAMGHGTFYRYFKNKLDIFCSVIDLIIVDLANVMETEDPYSTNSLEEYRQQILRIGNRLFTVFIEDSRMSQIIFYEALGVDRELDEKMDGVMRLMEAAIEQYLENGMSKGFLRADLDRVTTAKAVNAMIFGGAKDVMDAKDKKARSKAWNEVVARLMLEGMAARPPVNTP
ncbi:MAG: TetR/AcrR family transcriptional regulator [Desulfatibacillaceae bacterium]|nr:TetR/AcrR family transcriptional regulator [Desulfatibacillaceae bacterium]